MGYSSVTFKSMATGVRADVTQFRSPTQHDNRSILRCTHCVTRQNCLPHDLNLEEVVSLDEMVYTRQRVWHHQYLYRAGDQFTSLYAVRSGFFKTYLLNDDGHEHVTGFHMAGDIIGLDGIETNRHGLHAMALEDSEVCVIHYARLADIACKAPALQRQFHKIMSREIAKTHGLMAMLGSRTAEARIATFLLDISQRLIARGYAAGEFNLRMTREEIGSYLGLTLETVSRTFSRFQSQGLITVWQKHMQIHELGKLAQLADYAAPERHANAIETLAAAG
jgi:CRP/FNR family transcriptional regulator